MLLGNVTGYPSHLYLGGGEDPAMSVDTRTTQRHPKEGQGLVLARIGTATLAQFFDEQPELWDVHRRSWVRSLDGLRAAAGPADTSRGKREGLISPSGIRYGIGDMDINTHPKEVSEALGHRAIIASLHTHKGCQFLRRILQRWLISEGALQFIKGSRME